MDLYMWHSHQPSGDAVKQQRCARACALHVNDSVTRHRLSSATPGHTQQFVGIFVADSQTWRAQS
eukprot:8691248-Pyramimonas_sp.AAC.1